ncbi:MAG: HAMP domain-containing histidine kinase [Sphingomonas sp.]|nr:HAMP domain-containing histidine kinase [Sphingomonas sp.]
MRFDDRLLTVLNQPAGDRRDIAVRWRQLVDLVARAGSNAASPSIAAALEAIRAHAADVDETLRAATARAVAALPLPLGLLEFFASDRLSVSAPVLAAATLDPGQWQAVMRAADEETRRFIEALHPEIGSAPEEITDSLVESASEEPATDVPTPSLHDVVERIERRRRSRSMIKRNSGTASADSARLFRWECGPGGEIAWVDGAPRGAVIGRSIARAQDGEQLDPEVTRAFMLRAPFRDAKLCLAGDGPLSGDWKISGVPAFEPADGRFAGYRGIALREQEETVLPGPAASLLSDPDSVRELVHEIKTPLNAIMGFAEIIEGQYLGPADRRYRERAQEIVRQARLLLTAIDDLDFAAMIHTSSAGEERRANLGALVERMIPGLREIARARGVEIDGSRTTRDTSAATEPELADRLIFRMCSAVIEHAQPSEHLRLTVERAGDRSRVTMTTPAAISGVSDEQLFRGDIAHEHGFPLRLVRGLARLAGADLAVSPGSISLLFPRA